MNSKRYIIFFLLRVVCVILIFTNVEIESTLKAILVGIGVAFYGGLSYSEGRLDERDD